MLAARDGGDGGVLHVNRGQRGGRARWRVGDVHFGRSGVVVDARVDRGFFRIRLAAHDHPETAAVALKTTQATAA